VHAPTLGGRLGATGPRKGEATLAPVAAGPSAARTAATGSNRAVASDPPAAHSGACALGMAAVIGGDPSKVDMLGDEPVVEEGRGGRQARGVAKRHGIRMLQRTASFRRMSLNRHIDVHSSDTGVAGDTGVEGVGGTMWDPPLTGGPGVAITEHGSASVKEASAGLQDHSLFLHSQAELGPADPSRLGKTPRCRAVVSAKEKTPRNWNTESAV
ncbi:unnamed protein product, partial [Symbiodinium sp. KB8]